jgi:alkyl sulfatase BDS1-like metallo-beta-lactamase superfamily hydrolase
VRDRVVQGANKGLSIDEIAETAGVPPSLEDEPNLLELYGQADWSARAIYGNELGWFDGRAEALYPVPRAEVAERSVALMGGADAVLAEGERALEAGDPAWAAHLAALVRDGGGAEGTELLARALDAQAEGTTNTNGRAYLAEYASELRGGQVPMAKAVLDDALIDRIPLDTIFSVMATRLMPGEAIDTHETVHFDFGEVAYVVTVRRGVAEVVEGEALPGTPEPIATVRTDPATWRRLALGLVGPVGALADGSLQVEGDSVGLVRFLGRFEKE